MHVPDYQMHNVINVYSKQLRQNVAKKRRNKVLQRPRMDQIKIRPEGKRKTTIEKVSRDILEKISHYSSSKEYRQQIIEQAKVPSNEEASLHKSESKNFVFNEINAINQKSKNSLSVNDSSFLIKKFEQLA